VKDINDDSRLLYALEVFRTPTNWDKSSEEKHVSPVNNDSEQQQQLVNSDDRQCTVITATKCNPADDDAGASSFNTVEYSMDIDERDSNFWQTVNDMDSLCQQPAGDMPIPVVPTTVADVTNVNAYDSDAKTRSMANGVDSGCMGCATDLKTCAICLEVLSDIELKTHIPCKAIICLNCEEVSITGDLCCVPYVRLCS
jgi:hypothetical protein